MEEVELTEFQIMIGFGNYVLCATVEATHKTTLVDDNDNTLTRVYYAKKRK